MRANPIAIGFIIYNPTVHFIARINLLVGLGFKVYVFDNSPSLDATRNQLLEITGVEYSTFGKNVGLGIGITAVCSQAYYDGYSALMFFDQDTGFSAETLSFVNGFYKLQHKKLSGYSMVNFNSKYIVESIDSANYDNYDFVDVELAINSGSLYILNAVKDIGWHDLSYFVDGVDYKFCLDSAKKRYKIASCRHTPGFDHVTEQDDLVYRFFHKKFLARKYNAKRVRDGILSNFRLISDSLINGEFRLASKFLRFLFINTLVQSYVRVVGPVCK
ncbi:hypothetical protein [Vibrio aestuarianus]|uniref:Uncharacterized protein n=1 Tax=Vibrio aestuarianus TaxID=28171 RepID=A0A9X4FHV3_9VIBR|nr:hypothetical protein [Vibrio aestuarianus]MDE1348417.1 hypothetical protein [Vibrio aestuarianus]